MKQTDVPQDENLLKVTKEIQYALDDDGNYVQIKSTGWETKNSILKQAWADIDQELEEARQMVLRSEVSSLFFHMKKNLLDPATLAQYAGLFTFQVKRHFKPHVFQKLPEKMLRKYAEILNTDLSTLKIVPENKVTLADERL